MTTDEMSTELQDIKVRVVGVTLRDKGKLQQCNPQDLYLVPGEAVFIETEGGSETLATVKYGVRYIPKVLQSRPLKRVLRKLSATDLEKLHRHQQTEKEAAQYCTARISERRIPMKLVDVDLHFSEGNLTFYFTSDERVDFRELVKDLAYKYRARIEMRQIGVRDGAKMMDGIGPCGRTLCCSNFLKEFGQVSIRMAREQDLVLNPAKTSGLCGRLKCCIAYEHGMEKEGAAEGAGRQKKSFPPDNKPRDKNSSA